MLSTFDLFQFSSCVILAFAALFIVKLHRQRKFFKGLPQPPHSFLWGHLKVMGEVSKTFPPNCHPQNYLTTFAQRYGFKGIFYIDLWPIAFPMVVLTDPILMDTIEVTKPLPIHPIAEQVLSPAVGKNVVAVTNGSLWKNTHNAMAPAFTWASVRNLNPVVVDEMQKFREKLDSLAHAGTPFSFEDAIARLLFDVVGKVLFNVSLKAQEEDSQHLTDLREMVQLAQTGISYDPILHLRAYVRRKIVMKRLDASLTEKIESRLSLLKANKIIPSRIEPYSVLDLMLREHLQESQSNKDTATRGITHEYRALLLSNLKGLLLGGHGTTTDTLCYAFMLLFTSPEVLKKMRDEHNSVFGKDISDTLQLLHDDPSKLMELEYTTAVIKETLRLFPVGYSVREAQKGATIKYNGVDYPIGGLMVTPSWHTMHYDETYHPNPAVFKPERFLDSEGGVPRSNFRSFGKGNRACLGINLAMDEMRTVLLLVARDYQFQLHGVKPNKTPRACYTNLDTTYGDTVFQELGISASVRGGMWMTVEKLA